MRQETRRWIAQAQADFEAARTTLADGIYYVCAFLCHQAAEKALKAVVVETRRELPPKTHDPIGLKDLLTPPQELHSDLRRLNPAYVNTRYPDAANDVPAEIYDEVIAQELLSHAQRVMEWAQEQLGTI